VAKNEEEPWYAVRCLFRDDAVFEERITVWRADDFDDAIGQAVAEARQYAGDLGVEYLGLAQAFHVSVPELASGVEVFSLMRESDLTPEDYLSRFFDTGTELQQT
jgi:hypothetical protein